MTDYYEGTVEAIPLYASPPKGKEVDLHSNHAGNKQTKRSRNMFTMYMNMPLIKWCSKKQSRIETIVFCAKFVVMKIRADIS